MRFTIVESGTNLHKFKGKDIGTSDVWRMDAALKLGNITQEEMEEAEGAMCRSKGHCAVMGTASTMACMVESLGIALPGNASIPAADSRRKVFAHKSGMRIVDMVREDQKISQVLTKKAFENAIKVNAAIGGSTNFVIHGVDLTLADFDRCSMGIPLLTNVQPSGDYFVEDLYYAGGLPAVMKEMESYLHSDLITVSGKSVHDNIASAKSYNANVIATLEKPFKTETGLQTSRSMLIVYLYSKW